MSFVATDPPSHNSENTWFTPKQILDIFPVFDLDPCTVSYRPFNTALHHIEHDRGQCGLVAKWVGDVWLNPPYGREISPFIEKFIEHRQGVMLIFARMGSKDMQKLVRSGAIFYMLRKRIGFVRKDLTKMTNAGTDSCFVFYDKKYLNMCEKLDGVFMGKLTTQTLAQQNADKGAK